MSTPNNFEQEVLELLNRTRLNPAAEFDALFPPGNSRTTATDNIFSALIYFGVDMAALRSQFVSYAAVAPLAWNAALSLAATRHTDAMIAADAQSHQLPGEAGLRPRIVSAGYVDAGSLAENIYAFSFDPLYTHAGFYIDWGYDAVDFSAAGNLLPDWKTLGDGIQDGAGHRNVMMSPDYTEVGIAAIAETDPATKVGPWLVTEDFGSRSGYQAQLVGVVFDDADLDRFYDAGEGLAAVTINATPVAGGATITTTSWSSGGYQMQLAVGSYDVTFSSAVLAGPVTRNITIGTANVKLDLNADDATAGPDAMLGTAGADWLTPRASGHLIDGLAGVDMASFVAAIVGAVIDLNDGSALIGDQTWALRNIENVTATIFADLITGDGGANRIRALGDYDWMVGSGGGDSFEGGTGRDTVAYSSAASGVTASLQTGRGSGGQANGDAYADVENLTGSSFADRLTGDGDRNILRGLAGDDFLFGLGGNDSIDGSAGRDQIDGGAGNDRITGGRGNDSIDGGSGWDTAIFSARRADYTVTASANGSTTVLHSGGGLDGIDLLNNIEVLQFSDGRLFL